MASLDRSQSHANNPYVFTDPNANTNTNPVPDPNPHPVAIPISNAASDPDTRQCIPFS